MTTATIAAVNDIVKDGISAPVSGPVQLPAGTYWVGDLCYVISDDDWSSRVCKTYYRDVAVKLGSGETALIYGTVTGDGNYRTSKNFSLGVDSGSLGIIPKSAVDKYMAELSVDRGDAVVARGAEIVFTTEFICKQDRDNRLILLGDLKIYL